MTISFYKGLTRKPEIGNTPVCVLPNIWRLGRVRNTKFGMNISNKMLLNAAKCQGYSFYPVSVIKGKPTVLELIVLMKNWLKPLLDDKLLNNFTEWEISLCKLTLRACSFKVASLLEKERTVFICYFPTLLQQNELQSAKWLLFRR